MNVSIIGPICWDLLFVFANAVDRQKASFADFTTFISTLGVFPCSKCRAHTVIYLNQHLKSLRAGSCVQWVANYRNAVSAQQGKPAQPASYPHFSRRSFFHWLVAVVLYACHVYTTDLATHLEAAFALASSVDKRVEKHPSLRFHTGRQLLYDLAAAWRHSPSGLWINEWGNYDIDQPLRVPGHW